MPGNPKPRNLSQLVDAGAMDDAVDLRDRGYSGQRLRDKLSRLYPKAYHQSIRALADRSIQVRQARNALRESPPETPVSAVDVPFLPGARPGVTTTFEIPHVPPGASNPAPLRVRVEHSEGLTVGQLLEQGQQFIERWLFQTTAGYERLAQWLETQRLAALAGDDQAEADLRNFLSGLNPDDARITAVILGR